MQWEGTVERGTSNKVSKFTAFSNLRLHPVRRDTGLAESTRGCDHGGAGKDRPRRLEDLQFED